MQEIPLPDGDKAQHPDPEGPARDRDDRAEVVVEPRNLGLQPGLDYSDIGALLESAEGSGHR